MLRHRSANTNKYAPKRLEGVMLHFKFASSLSNVFEPDIISAATMMKFSTLTSRCLPLQKKIPEPATLLGSEEGCKVCVTSSPRATVPVQGVDITASSRLPAIDFDLEGDTMQNAYSHHRPT